MITTLTPDEIAEALLRNDTYTPHLAQTICEHFPTAMVELQNMGALDDFTIDLLPDFPYSAFVAALAPEDRAELLRSLLPEDSAARQHLAVDLAQRMSEAEAQRWYSFGVLVSRLARERV